MSWGILQQGCSVTNLQGTLSEAHIALENTPEPAPGLVLTSCLLSSSISLSASDSCRLIVTGVGVVVVAGLVVSKIRKTNKCGQKEMKLKIELSLFWKNCKVTCTLDMNLRVYMMIMKLFLLNLS